MAGWDVRVEKDDATREVLATTTTEDADVTLAPTKATAIADYIDASGDCHFYSQFVGVVVGGGQSLKADYIELEVTYTSSKFPFPAFWWTIAHRFLDGLRARD